MQRPRLTDRTAEALSGALTDLESYYEEAWQDPSWDSEKIANDKRAIEYLSDLLRWHRAKGKTK